jgi:hypothetical protein
VGSVEAAAACVGVGLQELEAEGHGKGSGPAIPGVGNMRRERRVEL